MSRATLLTTADLQHIFNVSRVTVWKYRNKFKMPVVRIRGDKKDGIRYNAARVLRWAKKSGRTQRATQLKTYLETTVNEKKQPRGRRTNSVG